MPPSDRPAAPGEVRAPTRLTLPRSHRLTRGRELDAVRREGKRVRTEHLEVRAVASLLRHGRVGIVVPRHRQSAVDRNRLKRRLRELIRTRLLPGLPLLDVVVRARPEAYGASFAALGKQVERMGKELKRVAGRGSRVEGAE